MEHATHARPSLTHAGLNVWDLPAMARFYEALLGLLRTDQGTSGTGAELVFLTAEADKHHQLVLVSGRPPGARSDVLNQLSFRVPALADVRALHDKALALGATAMRPVSHGNAWSIYFLDPEGNRIEIYCDTPWYVPQPHGEAIDFADSDEAIVRQTEAACRRDPGFCTVEEWQRRTTRQLGR